MIKISNEFFLRITWILSFIFYLLACSSTLYSQKIERDELESIVTFLSDQIKSEPCNSFYYSARGSAFFELGLLEKALSDFDMATNLDPENWERFYNKGIVLYDLERYIEALNAYSQAISLNDLTANAYNNRGLTYIKLRNYNLAIRDFTIAISLGKPESRHFYNRGYAKFLNGLLEEAIPDLEKSIELNENTIYGYYYLSLVYDEINEEKKALYYYEKAIANGFKP